jgi:hypothetical protein
MRHPIDITTEKRRLDGAGRTAYVWSLAVAGLGLAGTVIVALRPGGASRVLWSYLTNYAFFLSLALGALFFVLLQHLTHAGWSVVVRRLAEAVAANLPILALFALPVVLGAGTLYHWTHAEAVAHDEILRNKSAYLNLPFFVVRLVIYFAVWSFFAWWAFRRSVRQDETGDAAETLALERWAPLGMALFALTTTFAAFDLLMSLDPHWFSTVFGVYFFAGATVGFFALLAVVAYAVQRAGLLTRAITVEHYHDIGKFTFAFVVFWAYIAFSQFMLIWYGNLPEETIWYQRRVTGGWLPLSWLLLFGCFVIPFLGLISRAAKRRPAVLVGFGAFLLVMHWCDIYWLVMPERRHGAHAGPDFALADLWLFLLLGGAMAAFTVRRLSRCSVVAEGDPRLAESLAFENV